MQDWIRTIKESLSGRKGRKITGLIILPLVVIVLILIIVIADHKGSGTAEETTPAESMLSETTLESETELVSETIPVDQIPESVSLKKDEIPELTALVQAYCQAKIDCDVEALAVVFGEADAAVLADEAANMELVSRIVDSYENIACYSIDGPQTDTYVIYPYFEIQYKDAVQLMPSLTWAFVRKNEAGQFYMTQDITDAEKEYIAKVSKSPEVVQLKEEVLAQKDGAVAADTQLQWIYN